MLQRVFHISLALLLLISSSGLVLSQHFCRGELKSTALFVEASSCHSKAVRKHCPHHPPAQKESEPKKGCCDTTTDFLQLDGEQLATDCSIPSLEAPLMLAVLRVVSDVFILETTNSKITHYLNYKPPLLVRDLPVSLQTFLC